MDYNLYADFLNKYSQLTPWVQAVVAMGACASLVAVAYFCKEIIAIVLRPFGLAPKNDARQWRDKYYRDEP